jgi:hypothetical protein
MSSVEPTPTPPRSRTQPAVRIKTRFRVSPAAGLSMGLVAVAIGATVILSGGDGFSPRVPTLDALAGLAVAAFAVDRLLTFIPPLLAANKPGERARDIDTLRWGWGAALGAVFVWLTGLEAVAALTGGGEPIDPAIDRVIAVLAIAGGIKGLARVKDAVNPPNDTKGDMSGEEATQAVEDEEPVQPPPRLRAYLVGLAALVVAVVLAAFFAGDDTGLELIGTEAQDDGTMAVVVRFGPILVAAVVVEQLVERTFASSITGPAKKLLTASAAVVLGVVAARLMDLYLLHVIGFFGTSPGAGGLEAALGDSTDAERVLDVVVTGLVIGSGTALLHDLAASVKRAPAT